LPAQETLMARDSGLSLRCPQSAIFEAAPALWETGLLVVLGSRLRWFATQAIQPALNWYVSENWRR
jgi:hypothetical protein